MRTRNAIVVGSGPNGLSAAVTLAQAGLRVTVFEAADSPGGGARSGEVTLPGLVHDLCSAVHPFAAASPFLSSLPLEEFGLKWRFAKLDAAHPLDDGSAALLYRSIAATAAALGPDGPRWRSLFEPLAVRADDLVGDVLGPILRMPSHPLMMLRFGLRAAWPATTLGRYFRHEPARALFAGCAAHIFRPLNRVATSSVGTMMITAGHRYGWPVAEGGSSAITNALAGLLESLGGVVVTGTRVSRLSDLPSHDIAIFDVGPAAFADIAGGKLAPRRSRAYRRFRYGAAAFKLDLAVRGGIPWSAEHVGQAGTVHLGGSAAEIAAAERLVGRGIMPERPFVLVAQQHVADPGRAVGDICPVYAYAHVPHGHREDATAAIVGQIERFAPGFTGRILRVHASSPGDFERGNPNYVGGDIVGGSNTLRGLVGRPVIARDNYATSIPGVYLCSSSTPPGAGTHGMCGHLAARSALAHLR
ncbi:NAD(P)/FAD-dependent oxidoreductase [Actinoallomurus bryophytorum]|uniref:Phytoene dehydrogenase-like protein n=1 Tax=Actinoallomurus bryophytorum TaxID=1490222 RepID=A0A543CUW5_9ACTN|nr:phytoene dehydrogenase-like protein [Actinoallomurus bryophytorum]